MKKICILYTGGTIGMIKTDRGYEPKSGYLEKIVNKILNPIEGVVFDVIEYNPLIDSANQDITKIQKIANDIYSNYDKYDGFVVLHGTDTMHYTASLLSFMFDGLMKPVIFTGSQIPISQVRNDVASNILTAMLFATNESIKEVCVFFANNLYRGNRVEKISSDRLDAFESPNYPSLASVGIDLIVDEKLLYKSSKDKISIVKLKDPSIVFFRITPSVKIKQLKILLDYADAIVLELYGVGNYKEMDGDFVSWLKEARDRNVLVVATTQCVRGRVQFGAYKSGMGLVDLDVVNAKDMTIAAIYAKLVYLFSIDLDIKEIRLKMEENLRGECF